MKIYEALAGINVPVCHPPYRGASTTYITYQLLGQVGQLYAEGCEAETGVQYAVSLFAEGFVADLLAQVKAALEAGGYIVSVDMEMYDADTGRTQVALLAECEGAEYG